MPSDAVASSSLAVEKSPSLMEDARSPAFFFSFLCEKTFGDRVGFGCELFRRNQ